MGGERWLPDLSYLCGSSGQRGRAWMDIYFGIFLFFRGRKDQRQCRRHTRVHLHTHTHASLGRRKREEKEPGYYTDAVNTCPRLSPPAAACGPQPLAGRPSCPGDWAAKVPPPAPVSLGGSLWDMKASLEGQLQGRLGQPSPPVGTATLVHLLMGGSKPPKQGLGVIGRLQLSPLGPGAWRMWSPCPH